MPPIALLGRCPSGSELTCSKLLLVATSHRQQLFPNTSKCSQESLKSKPHPCYSKIPMFGFRRRRKGPAAVPVPLVTAVHAEFLPTQLAFQRLKEQLFMKAPGFSRIHRAAAL